MHVGRTAFLWRFEHCRLCVRLSVPVPLAALVRPPVPAAARDPCLRCRRPRRRRRRCPRRRSSPPVHTDTLTLTYALHRTTPACIYYAQRICTCMYVNVCSGTICHICRMLSSATLATTQGCDRFRLKSDTLAVWPPCTNSNSAGPDTITDRQTEKHVRRVRSGHVHTQ
jgi:hypothetical protein